MPSRLLLIDDDPTILQALNAKLSALPDLEVRTTADSTGIPKLARVFNPHLIVCDVDMEPLNGGDVARELQEDPSTADIPLVFLSSLVDPQHVARNQGVIGGKRMISKQSGLPAIIERIQAELKLALG